MKKDEIKQVRETLEPLLEKFEPGQVQDVLSALRWENAQNKSEPKPTPKKKT